MRTSLRLIAAAVLMLTIGADMSALTTDEPITISGKEYTLRTYVRRDIGPGTTYTRYSVIGFPLNVNVITMDLDNPYNTLETMQAKDRTNSTETLVSAAARYTSPEHKVIGGANGNFWCVSSQYPSSDFLVGTVFGADTFDDAPVPGITIGIAFDRLECFVTAEVAVIHAHLAIVYHSIDLREFSGIKFVTLYGAFPAHGLEP